MSFSHANALAFAFVALSPIVSNLYPQERKDLKELEGIAARYRSHRAKLLAISPVHAELAPLESDLARIDALIADLLALAGRR